MLLCPHCGQSLHGLPCPHCGAAVILVRWRLIGALVILGGWLTFGVVWWLTPPLPLALSVLPTTRALTYAAVSGVVVAPPQYDPQTQTFSFDLRDDTGTGRVVLPSFVVGALQPTAQFPALGDQVTAYGLVNSLTATPHLIVTSVNALAIAPPQPIRATIRVALDLAREPVTLPAVEVVGQVIALRDDQITLQDASGVIDALYPETTRQLTGDLPPLQPDDIVRVMGVIMRFHDRPYLMLNAARHLTPLPPDTALEIGRVPDVIPPMSDVQVGALTKISGTVTALHSYAGGFQFTLTDGTGTVRLHLPERLYKQITTVHGLRLGARAQATGFIEIQQGELELTPLEASAVNLLSPAPDPITFTPLSEINLTHIGQFLTVQGHVIETIELPNARRLTIADNTSLISVLIWNNVLAYAVDAPRLRESQELIITGQISHYRGLLEIIPSTGFDITLK